MALTAGSGLARWKNAGSFHRDESSSWKPGASPVYEHGICGFKSPSRMSGARATVTIVFFILFLFFRFSRFESSAILQEGQGFVNLLFEKCENFANCHRKSRF